MAGQAAFYSVNVAEWSENGRGPTVILYSDVHMKVALPKNGQMVGKQLKTRNLIEFTQPIITETHLERARWSLVLVVE